MFTLLLLVVVQKIYLIPVSRVEMMRLTVIGEVDYYCWCGLLETKAANDGAISAILLLLLHSGLPSL